MSFYDATKRLELPLDRGHAAQVCNLYVVMCFQVRIDGPQLLKAGDRVLRTNGATMWWLGSSSASLRY